MLFFGLFMRIPLTKYGWPQVVVAPVIILIAMIFIALSAIKHTPSYIIIPAEIILTALLIFSLAFFRDPDRKCQNDINLLLAPADGVVTDIATAVSNEYVGQDALRIGIFLSIFNTHINRAPCNVKVEDIIYKKGKYKNALNPESARVNESNEIRLTRIDNPKERLIVRQISGAIARRIVCRVKSGRQLAAGEKFGMIKFGSRTELYAASSDTKYKMEPLVKKGDKVKAGLTPLVRYIR
jgi:phosphatidylserine decarboxylase